jgi:long-chain acyl-CoA synthetase
METAAYPWQQHYPDGLVWESEIDASPMHMRLDRAAEQYPNHPCVEFKGRVFTYHEIAEKVARFARGLHEMGIGKGSKVGIYLPNCPQFIIAYYGILRAGATVVNYNPLYSPRELEHQIVDSGTQVMVTLSLKALYDKLAPMLEKTCLTTIIVSEMSEALSVAKGALFAIAKAKEIADIPFDDVHVPFARMMEYPPLVQTAHICPHEDIAVLQYTGGTTGVPKGVVLTHANLTANIRQCRLWFASAKDGQETIIGVLPFFHVFAMTVVMNFAIASGFRIIMHPRFELRAVLDDIQKYHPSLMPGVPTMFATMVNYSKIGKYNLRSLKMCISGGAPLPYEVKIRFEELTGAKLFEGYGLSEASPVVACNPIYKENKLGSIGMPLPATVLEIVDKDDGVTLLPQGEVGEICVRGPQVMSSYWNKPEETALVLKNGRLYTGDIGYMDEDGYFFVVDRKKEMILSGGYNVYPRTIEEVIYQHCDVLEVAVIGVPHALRGQVPKAFVVVKEGKRLTEEDIRAFLKDKLSAYAHPHVYEFRDALPKSMIGKILKKELI